MDKELEKMVSEQPPVGESDLERGDGRLKKVEKETHPEGWIEKVEKQSEKDDIQVTDDPTVSSDDASASSGDTTLPDDAVVLPMTQQEFEEGIRAPMLKAIRWLAEWSAYLIKKFGKRVFFKG